MSEEREEKILFYNGTYVKDRRYGQKYDYLTYEENSRRDYNIYIDLDSNEVYHVELSDCELFEQENFVIKIPVVATSSHEYMYNYINLLTWYNGEKNNKSKESIKEELQEKYGNKPNVKKYA